MSDTSSSSSRGVFGGGWRWRQQRQKLSQTAAGRRRSPAVGQDGAAAGRGGRERAGDHPANLNQAPECVHTRILRGLPVLVPVAYSTLLIIARELHRILNTRVTSYYGSYSAIYIYNSNRM